eukprot:765572-Hanusia_phi.AAC.5
MLRNLPLAAAMVAASLTVVGGFALNGGATSCMLRAKGARSALVDVKGRSRRTSLTMAEDFPASRSRREVLFGLGAAAFLFVAPAESKEAINDCDKWAPGRKYITGKSCQEKGSNVSGDPCGGEGNEEGPEVPPINPELPVKMPGMNLGSLDADN